MSSSYLEQLRSTMSSVEVIEKAIVQCLFGKKTLPQHSVLLDHRINNLMTMSQKYSQEALQLIEGADGWKRDEMEALSGQNRKDGDAWDNFYDRYKEIKDYHRKISQGHTMPQVSTNKVENFFDQAFEPPFNEPYFSGEEANGRYLDLHANYQEFLNLKKLKESEEYKRGDYLWYLQNFDLFHEIPQNIKEKEGSKYKAYLNNLLTYIKGFYSRVNPLQDINRVHESFEVDFERQWKSGVVRGWERLSIDEIQNNELYCHVCSKLFQNENTYVHHFQGKRHKKLAKLKEKNLDVAEQNGNQEENEIDEEQIDVTLKTRKKFAYLEYLINCYKEQLTSIVNDTMNLVRKKQSRSYDDGDVDAEGQEGAENNQGDDHSESESPMYNPKNLPLGWDGRPIPYWLYKLHGLGVEYKCEICGNTSYWGRKAFEDHFQGWRHSYGMRCLRIPNTLHFKEITKIQDAITLYQRIQLEQEKNKFRPDYDEEYEDNEGNLLNKKTFYDLKKQGLS